MLLRFLGTRMAQYEPSGEDAVMLTGVCGQNLIPL